jgi:hypothetical protein
MPRVHAQGGRQGSAGRRENANHLAANTPPIHHASPSASLTLVHQLGWGCRLAPAASPVACAALHRSPPMSSVCWPALGGCGAWFQRCGGKCVSDAMRWWRSIACSLIPEHWQRKSLCPSASPHARAPCVWRKGNVSRSIALCSTASILQLKERRRSQKGRGGGVRKDVVRAERAGPSNLLIPETHASAKIMA